MTGQSKMQYNREGFIYKLYNESCEEVYIGSTRDIIERMKTHKQKCKSDKNPKYKFIRENGDWENWKYIILCHCEIISDIDLRILEQSYMDNENKLINRHNANTTVEERHSKQLSQKKIRYENNKEEHARKAKIYRENNKELCAERIKKYRENNKEKIAIAKSIYGQKNKEIIAVKNKIRREENKEKYIIKGALYREKNREKTRKQVRENIYVCICGSNVSNCKSHIVIHENTKKHIKLSFIYCIKNWREHIG